MKKIFDKNSWILGIVIAVLLPAIVYGLVYGLNHLFGKSAYNNYYLNDSTVMLISIFSNLFPFRYYMIVNTHDKTGKGILLVTILFALLFFYLYL